MGLLQIDQFVEILADSEDVRVGVLAQLTFKVLPKDTENVASLFCCRFHFEPVFQALEMDEADAARALARHDTRVLDCAIVTPAVFALATVCAICA